MKITQLLPQKRGTRFNLFTDDKFAFGVSSFVASKYKLTEGLEISPVDLENIYCEEQVEFLKQKAMDFLSARPRSEKEVRDKLKLRYSVHSKKTKYQLPDSKYQEIEAAVLAFLTKYRYLDDQKFAEWLVGQRLAQGKGPQFIKQDLFQKGVDKDVIKSVLASLDTNKALAKTYKKGLKKYEKEPDPYKKKQKLYRYLASRGFNIDQINSVLS
jgi:regulatory protein